LFLWTHDITPKARSLILVIPGRCAASNPE
jgi:hypothetical protein